MSGFKKAQLGSYSGQKRGYKLVGEKCMLNLEQRVVSEFLFDGPWHEIVMEYLESASRLELLVVLKLSFRMLWSLGMRSSSLSWWWWFTLSSVIDLWIVRTLV